MMRCSPEAFAKCPTSHLCGSLADATFTEDSECAAFNQKVDASYIRAGVIQQWIPVTDRLPTFTSERRRSVLVTLEDRQGKRLVTTAKYNPEYEEWYEFKYSRFYDFKVLAWMPKPKRYEPPKEEAHGRSDC